MSHWKCKMIWALSSLCLLVNSPIANATSAGDCCYQPECGCSRFLIGADFLWWKPCVDNLDYAAEYGVEMKSAQVTAVTEPCPPTGPLIINNIKYKSIGTDWEPGVRIRLALVDVWGPLSLSGSYTWIEADSTSSTTLAANSTLNLAAPLLHGALTELGTQAKFKHARGKYEAEYQNWDVLFSFVHEHGCHKITPFFGAEGIFLDQKMHVTLTNERDCLSQAPNNGNSAHIKWDNDIWAVGMKVGAGYSFKLSDCFHLFARGSGSVLAGELDSGKNHQLLKNGMTNEGFIANIRDSDNRCHLIPGYHVAAGLRYTSTFCDSDYSVQLGYEFLEWHNVPNPRIFMGDDAQREGAHSTSPSTRTFGFHGLFVGANVVF